MSLMSTLTKMAVGVAVAKGASSLLGGGSSEDGGLGGLLSGLTSGGEGTGGVQDMLGGLMGGGEGGLGAMLGTLGGDSAGGDSPLAGMSGLLGGLAGAGGAAGLVGLLSGALSGEVEKEGTTSVPGLNPAFGQAQDDQDALAAVMLKAMIQAAKSDGTMDDDERQKVIGHLGNDLEEAEAAFIQQQLQAPVDVEALVAEVPSGKEEQIYGISLLAIDLDSQAEAQYLHQLAAGLGLETSRVNALHDQMGVAPLYT